MAWVEPRQQPCYSVPPHSSEPLTWPRTQHDRQPTFRLVAGSNRQQVGDLPVTRLSLVICLARTRDQYSSALPAYTGRSFTHSRLTSDRTLVLALAHADHLTMVVEGCLAGILPPDLSHLIPTTHNPPLWRGTTEPR